MKRSPWDKPGLAREIDAYWDSAGECAFRQTVVADLRGRLQPGNVLEVGCGSGRIYGALADAGLLAERAYCGGDNSLRMLALARRRYPAATFRALDVCDLHEQADNVLCVQVLQHLADWRPALAGLLEASRKLLYVVAWFGNGDRYYEDATGIWHNWLDAGEFVARCQPYGVVTQTYLGDTVSAVAVQR